MLLPRPMATLVTIMHTPLLRLVTLRRRLLFRPVVLEREQQPRSVTSAVFRSPLQSL